MFMSTVVLGLVWFLERKVWKPARGKAAIKAVENSDMDRASLILERPFLASFCCLMFPVFLYVLLVRSFVFEVYRIPTESMLPNYKVGDSILIDKSVYNISEPLFHMNLFTTDDPERGDVVVFLLPGNPGTNYIKRIIGLPGDKIIHRSKEFTVIKPQGDSPLSSSFASHGKGHTTEVKDNYRFMTDPEKPTREDSFFLQDGQPIGEWVVPEGHYFVLGDNRDHSQDSRFWGFVPRSNLVGRVFISW